MPDPTEAPDHDGGRRAPRLIAPTPPDPIGPGLPTPAIALAGPTEATTARLRGRRVDVDDALLDRLRSACADVSVDAGTRAEASRDWWPLAMTWALDNTVAGLAAAVARPSSEDEVAALLAICDEARLPVTPAAGRSGVVGGSVPVFGGVVLDLCGLSGIRDVDDTSLVLDVAAGTFGDHLEEELRREHHLTVGHWPQSIALSTVGGWLACRGAGQLSNRYGKTEDMVIGLDVVLADGRRITTGGNARQAVGPDLTQLFVGSEGTLGVITGARMRLHPVPAAEARSAHGFDTFGEGLDACRRILRRGATPAALRLYDAAEADRSWSTGTRAVLLVLDEGDPLLVEAAMAVTEQECRHAERLDDELVARWHGHRNDVAALEALVSTRLRRRHHGDHRPVGRPRRHLRRRHRGPVRRPRGGGGVGPPVAQLQRRGLPLLHLRRQTIDRPQHRRQGRLLRACWDAGTTAVLERGGSLSHHHGIGLNRARFMASALGAQGLDTLAAVKQALDPNGILNPGKLALPSPFGDPGWPSDVGTTL